MGLPGSCWLTFQQHAFALLLGLLTLLSIGLDPLQELQPGIGVLDMLHTNMDPLLNISVANDLVEQHTNAGPGHVKHHARSAVVEVVWKSLLDRSIHLDVHNVTFLVRVEVRLQPRSTVLPEATGEFVASTTSITVSVCSSAC